MGYIKDVIETIDKEDKTIFKDEERLAIYNNYIYEKEFKDKLKKMADKPSFTTVSNIEEKLLTIFNF